MPLIRVNCRENSFTRRCRRLRLNPADARELRTECGPGYWAVYDDDEELICIRSRPLKDRAKLIRSLRDEEAA